MTYLFTAELQKVEDRTVSYEIHKLTNSIGKRKNLLKCESS